jgi:hypothetical protein
VRVLPTLSVLDEHLARVDVDFVLRWPIGERGKHCGDQTALALCGGLRYVALNLRVVPRDSLRVALGPPALKLSVSKRFVVFGLRVALRSAARDLHDFGGRVEPFAIQPRRAQSAVKVFLEYTIAGDSANNL